MISCYMDMSEKTPPLIMGLLGVWNSSSWAILLSRDYSLLRGVTATLPSSHQQVDWRATESEYSRGMVPL